MRSDRGGETVSRINKGSGSRSRYAEAAVEVKQGQNNNIE